MAEYYRVNGINPSKASVSGCYDRTLLEMAMDNKGAEMTIDAIWLIGFAGITLGICILIGLTSLIADIAVWWEDRKFSRRVKIQRIN